MENKEVDRIKRMADQLMAGRLAAIECLRDQMAGKELDNDEWAAWMSSFVGTVIAGIYASVDGRDDVAEEILKAAAMVSQDMHEDWVGDGKSVH